METMIGNLRTLRTLMSVVFMTFALTGAALPTLPFHLQNELGQDVFIVGVIAGLQFCTALISRMWAGSYADRKGPKPAIIIGLYMASGAGALYLVSLTLLNLPLASVLVLASGRALMGSAECFVLVGAVSWSLRLSGSARTGKAIAQMGNAMYVGLALGAPLGSILFDRSGFQVVGLATLVLPLFTLFAILPLPTLSTETQKSGSLLVVLKSVWLPGVGLSFASLGYGAMMSFSVLLFVKRGWQPAWIAFTIFAISFITVRMVFGNLADRFGGARIAQLFSVVQVAGLVLIATSPWAILGYVGAAFTGAGYSLVYPSFGLEAINRSPVTSKGLAIGTYTAFLELSLAIASPLLGLLASWKSLGAVFIVSAIAAAGAAFVGAVLRKIPVLEESTK